MLDHLGLTTFETYALWAVLGVAILGLLYALFLRREVLKEDTGTPQMREVWDAIRTGADAYLNRQLRTILPFHRHSYRPAILERLHCAAFHRGTRTLPGHG